MRTALRFVPDSRWVLRTAMVVTAGAAMLFMTAGAREYGVLTTAGHPRMDLLVQLAPWGLLAFATLLGTAELIEDAVFRRRMVLALALGAFFILVGVAFWRFLPPKSDAIGLVRSFLVYWTVWAPGYWFVAGRGFGPSSDAWLTRWIGPAPVGQSNTELQRRDREIREAASAAERHRLAQDLHDSIKQEIFAIHTSAATIQARLISDPEGAQQALEQVRRSSRDAMTGIEAMLDRLSPTLAENTGLVGALRKQCEALALRTGAEVVCDIRPLPASKLLPPGAHEALFRIAQEALSNVGKHARASRVVLTLRTAERDVILTIEDNGQGFDKMDPAPEARLGMGLKNMQERSRSIGGRFRFLAFPGGGVTVEVGVPVLQPSVFTAGVPKWILWTGSALVILPAAVALYLLLFSRTERMGWTSVAYVLACGVILWLSFWPATREARRGNFLK